jgi:ABC-2 type transport system permease protein
MSTETTHAPAERSPELPSLASTGWARVAIELKLFFREKEGVFFIFLFPPMLLVLFAAVFGDDFSDGQVSAAQYFMPTMLALGVLLTSFQNVALAIAVDREDGTLKRLRGTPMPPSAYFIGKVGMVAIASALQIGLILALGSVAYNTTMPDGDGWLRLGWLWLLGTASGTLLGIAISTVLRSAKAANSIVTPIAILLPFISGVYFMFSELPGWMQTVGALFPLKWLAQGTRSVFLPDQLKSLEASGSWQIPEVALVLGIWTVIGLVLAMWTFRWNRVGER